jgi:nicotinamide-nucleotide amidase
VERKKKNESKNNNKESIRKNKRPVPKLQGKTMDYNRKILAEMKTVLLDKKLTVAVAESVTSGHLQAAFSSVEDSGKIYHGGITTYNLGQKVKHLNVNAIPAEECNSVSDEIAVQMAFGVIRLFSAHIGISITGYASPLPEKGITDLFAFYAIAYKDSLIDVNKIETNYKDPVKAQVDYVNQIMEKSLPLIRKLKT